MERLGDSEKYLQVWLWQLLHKQFPLFFCDKTLSFFLSKGRGNLVILTPVVFMNKIFSHCNNWLWWQGGQTAYRQGSCIVREVVHLYTKMLTDWHFLLSGYYYYALYIKFLFYPFLNCHIWAAGRLLAGRGNDYL